MDQKEIINLYGIGKSTILKLQKALNTNGFDFKS